MDHGTFNWIGKDIRSPSVTDDSDHAAEQRLIRLLELNGAVAREQSLYRNPQERFEASVMKRPIGSRQAYSRFGFMIGSLPPATIALKLANLTSVEPTADVYLLLLLFLLASLTTGVVGFHLGKYIPTVLHKAEHLRLPNHVIAVSAIGLVWGAIAGAVGGLFLLVIGAVVAAVVGAVVGTVSVPLFVLLHRLVRRGDLIEVKHFLPISLAITLSVCAFIFGL